MTDASTNYIKLKRNGALVCVDKILAIIPTTEEGGRWARWPKIKIHYPCKVITLHYGSDDKYVHETRCQRARDSDLSQLHEALHPQETKGG